MKDSLETLSMVDRLRKELAKNPNYLRDQIRPMILDNPHKGSSFRLNLIFVLNSKSKNRAI